MGWLSRINQAQSHHVSPQKARVRGQLKYQRVVLKKEEKGIEQGMCADFRGWQMEGKGFSSGASWKKYGPHERTTTDPIILIQWNLCHTSDLKMCKIMFAFFEATKFVAKTAIEN